VALFPDWYSSHNKRGYRQVTQDMTSSTSTQTIRFHLAISAKKYLAYYQGVAKSIVTCSADNRSIRFPADSVRKFLTHDGIYGLFEIQFDGNNKLIGVKKIGDK